ncbi:Glutamine-dependent NAD(+) synthetase [Botrimarina colliarenosi]|uniref:Glutamine-dependent NAD(+) synthetase n=1 Tax=Botrimarina colliarenosi TaxID=2528001 RepID=A0A5C6A786_9BACT|nr:NAD(+) synthase [Botrimarina colliarenosi]TWT95862.1 Glutamine-dependent NAD(+) synthetase [Botrimarina colliarenosi]
MPTLRIAAAALNQTPIDWEANLSRTVAAIDAARDAGARLVCLPELCLSGYGCEDLYFAKHVRERALGSLQELAPQTKGIAVTVGLPLEIDGVLRNAEAMLIDGRLVGFALKQHLANDGIHYEARWFTPWPAGQQTTVEVDGESIPAGELVFDFDGVGLGIEICRDAWVGSERPASRYAERGVSVLLNPSASHFAFGKQAIRDGHALLGAKLVNGLFVYTNLLGNESGRAIFDGGVFFTRATAAGPELLAGTEPFSCRDYVLSLIDAEVDARPGAGRVETGWSLMAPADQRDDTKPVLRGERLSKFEEFSRAVSLGLLDYLRKSGARGFVLSLSGGADSAACAVLVWLVAKRVIGEVGVGGLAERLPKTPGLTEATEARSAVRHLLTTAYQGTKNSSDVTRDAAAAIAEAVGAEHHAWTIDTLVADYVGLAETALGRDLTWETDDIALQNIQARVRAPGVWLLANLKNALLVTTGNRSEASVGYATMDGDTAGGLAPIAGIDKAFLREWLRWMETEGPAGIGPLPDLACINAQQPTAELRPLDTHQTDEADLMPYPVLDAIERSMIAHLEPRDETLRRLGEAFPQYETAQLVTWTDRFWRLWRASQWKRERLAPGFHLDTHNVDSRTWRRWPILSGEG